VDNALGGRSEERNEIDNDEILMKQDEVRKIEV
jgi:hypothetical protein